MDTAEDGICHAVSPVNISFLHAFLSRDLSPMKLPFPDLPNSSMANTSFSSLGYELKPAASLHPASHDASLENLFVPLISITPSKCLDFCAPAPLTRGLLVLFCDFGRGASQSSFMLCRLAGEKS